MPPVTAQQLTHILQTPLQSVQDLQRYYNINQPATAQLFAGRAFNSLGSPTLTEARFTPADILAVECLSVRVPIDVALELLDPAKGSLGSQIAEHLAKVPGALELGSGNATPPAMVGEGDAVKAWELLKTVTGIGWVTAGKLLARKRPKLIPVWDSVVRCAMGKPKAGQVWTWLDRLMRNPTVRKALATLHAQAGLPATVPLLRALDVVMWMRHRAGHRPSRCPGL